MEAAKMILTEAVSSPELLERIDKVDTSTEAKKKQFAKDFESIIITKLLEEMRRSIGDWGFEKDGPSKQIQGIFWSYLGESLGKQGGFGMWKEIYNSLKGVEPNQDNSQSLDSNI